MQEVVVPAESFRIAPISYFSVKRINWTSSRYTFTWSSVAHDSLLPGLYI
jgi:hypothetical protein